jgi:outer membrane murein-binding lipoprotein Lpp
MTKLFTRAFAFFLCMFVVVGGISNVSAQRKRKLSRRITNPVTASPSPTPLPPGNLDPAIVSTAGDGETQTSSAPDKQSSPSRNPRATLSGPSDPDSVRRRVDSLSGQVEQLNSKLAQMEEDQRSLGYIEKLTRAEQRAEDLRAQLRDVQSKQLDYQARMDQIDVDLRPQNIDVSMSAVGSLHPEELRAQRKLLLENDKKRVQAQLDLLDKSRLRLESAIEMADLEVQKLQERVDPTGEQLKVKTGKKEPENTEEPAKKEPASPEEPALP